MTTKILSSFQESLDRENDYFEDSSQDRLIEKSLKNEGNVYDEHRENPLILTSEEKDKNDNFDMNSFKMVILVAHRTKEIEAGMPLYVPHETDKKDMLLALKEVETKALSLSDLEDRVVASYQQFSFLSKATS